MSIENNTQQAADKDRDGAADVKSKAQNAAENIKDKVGNAIDNIENSQTKPSKVIGADNDEDEAKNADAEAKAKVYNLK
jgi:hypothetical protein